jgi:hypothetical protein
MLMSGQAKVSPQRGLPVDLTNIAKRTIVRSAETIQLHYFNGNTFTQDSGQAAGVVVVGKTSYAPIVGTLGANIASSGNTSLYFTGTALTSEVAMDNAIFEATDYSSAVDVAKTITNSLSNGQYVVDYRNGVIYGKKADTGSTLTAASYKICALTTFEFANSDWNSPSSSVSSSPSTSPSSSTSTSPSTSVSSSPSASVSPSTSLSNSPSLSRSSSVSSSPSTSTSTSPSSSVSPSTSVSNSKSTSPSASPSLP